MNKRSVLLIEDNPGDARLFREMFREYGSQNAELTHVESMRDAETHLAQSVFDIILLDPGLPDASGLAAVRRVRAAAPHVSLVVLSGLDDELMALQAMKEGAQDYLIKGQIEPREMMRALRYAIERKNIEEVLFAEKERAQVTLDCIGDAVVCTDTAVNVTFLNAVAEKLTGWTIQEAVGQPISKVLQIVNANTRAPMPNPMGRVMEQDRPGHLPPNCLLIRRDGGEIAIEDSASPIRDRDGKSIGAVIVFRDVSAVRAMTLQMTHSAEHDFLTDLPNRFLLNDRIGQAIALAERHNYRLAVIFLDLDGFKHINDSLGHAIGDKLLQSIATRLAGCVRAVDTISRQGGDEFIILLPEITQPEAAAITANRVLQAVAEPHPIGQHDLHVTGSIGVSVYPDDGCDTETLIKNADTAMYQAKEDGRQGYKFFKPAMNVRAVERQSIEENLRRALERNELALHYQPKVDLLSGMITGVEALVRWTHPTRGLVSPAQFIPIAEDCGLILPIGAWVLQEACRQAHLWVKAGLPPITMAVNVSALQFRNKDFVQNMFATLRETGHDPKFLEIELTESVLMKRAEVTVSILQTLRDQGVKVSVDDFGTGYSSLSYLRKFPLDILKIDQSFIRQITTVPSETAIVSAMIAMGQSLDLRVVAEGVETREELEYLRDHKCDEAQGYYFSRPVSADAFAALLQRQHSIGHAGLADDLTQQNEQTVAKVAVSSVKR